MNQPIGLKQTEKRIKKMNEWLHGKKFLIRLRREEIVLGDRVLKYYSQRIYGNEPFFIEDPDKAEKALKNALARVEEDRLFAKEQAEKLKTPLIFTTKPIKNGDIQINDKKKGSEPKGIRFYGETKER